MQQEPCTFQASETGLAVAQKGTTPTFRREPPAPPNAPSEPRGVSLSHPGAQKLECGVNITLTEAEGKFADALLSCRLKLSDIGDGSRCWLWLVRLGGNAGLGEDGVKYLCWLFWSHRGDEGECPFSDSVRLKVSRGKAVRRIRDWGSSQGLCEGRIADAEEVLERYTEVMRDEGEKSAVRLDAMKALGTKLGLFKDEGKSGGRNVTIVVVNPYGDAGAQPPKAIEV